jgi:hypothetical protein
MNHVYFLKVQPNKSVKPFVTDGSGLRESRSEDLDWKAGDSVRFKPDDGFTMKVVVVEGPARTKLDAGPLGVDTITDESPRIVPAQSHDGNKSFGFRCTLISKSGESIGWLSAADDKTSGSGDGNVHN